MGLIELVVGTCIAASTTEGVPGATLASGSLTPASGAMDGAAGALGATHAPDTQDCPLGQGAVALQAAGGNIGALQRPLWQVCPFGQSPFATH
jgi:hypothetical protein